MIEGGQAILQKIVYLFGNLACLALALYKCSSMGLLPTHASDWLDFVEPLQVSLLTLDRKLLLVWWNIIYLNSNERIVAKWRTVLVRCRVVDCCDCMCAVWVSSKGAMHFSLCIECVHLSCCDSGSLISYGITFGFERCFLFLLA